MASQSIPNIVVKNQEIKDKLNEKIQANYNELALLSKHLIKSSRSNENLEKSAKIFASHENIIESSLTNLKKVGLLVSNLQFQAEAAEKSLSMLEDIQDKIKLATRTS